MADPGAILGVNDDPEKVSGSGKGMAWFIPPCTPGAPQALRSPRKRPFARDIDDLEVQAHALVPRLVVAGQAGF